MPKRAAYPAPTVATGINALFSVKSNKVPDGLTTQIPVSDIFISPLQYRHYVDEIEIEALAKSIKAQGLLEAIVVRQVEERYELAIGQKRWLAHQHLGLSTIEAKILDLTDDALVEISLIENNQRSQPNVWEETCGILKLLELRLSLSQSEVVSLLNQAANQKKGATNNVIRSDQWEALEAVLSSVSTLTPDSFRANRLPILNLPDDIQLALRQGKLEYTKARAIAQIEDSDHRLNLLDSAIQEKLSIREIRERVQTFKRIQTVSNRLTLSDPVKERQQSLKHLSSKVKTLTPDKQKKFDKLLQQMMELIEPVKSAD
ncbi:MAG TPA: ParB/RepB/Spo0J family partition protein [Coleofasciculaceae cyanobacterium]